MKLKASELLIKRRIMLEKMQAIAFQMIATVGTAKSMYIEALQLAKNGQFDEAQELYVSADEIYSEAHTLHFELVQKEANGEQLPFSLMLMHAEDQMLNAETVKIFGVER